MASRLRTPRSYTIVDGQEILRNQNGVVAVVQAPDEFSPDG